MYTEYSFIYICDDKRKYGLIDKFGLFSFENALRRIKRLIRNSMLLLQQISNCLSNRSTPSYAFNMLAKIQPKLLNI